MAASKFNPFFVSYGNEDLLLDRDLDRAKSWAGRRVVRLDGGSLTDETLVELCETQSDEPRTIILDNAQELDGDDALKAYIERRNPQDPSVILVAIVRSEKLPEVWSLASSKGRGHERKSFKPWETEKYSKWIRNEAESHRTIMDDSVAQLLIQYVGTNLYRLANEVKKLASYVGPLGKIQKEHILLVTTITPQADPTKVAEATLSKDIKKAFNYLSVLYMQSGDDILIPVVYALMKQVERALVIRSLLDKRVADDEIAAVAGVKPWPYKNTWAPIAKKHDPKSLVRHMGRLCQLDADVKGPARSRTLVELAMLSIAT
jgi:DNA polymerase III subunit delta